MPNWQFLGIFRSKSGNSVKIWSFWCSTISHFQFGGILAFLGPKLTDFKVLPDLDVNFPPKITDFGVFGRFLVILNLNHLATLWKWPKSLNYQISQCCQIWMWIFSKIAKTAENCMKMPIFGKNCLKSAKSSHAVPTEHTFTGLPAISAL